MVKQVFQKLRSAICLLSGFGLLSACQISALPLANPQLHSAALSLSSHESQVLLNEAADAPYLMRTRSGLFLLVYHQLEAPHTQLFLRSSEDGQNWSAPQQLTSHELSVNHPKIIEDSSGELHLFYSSNEQGRWQIYKSSSKDGLRWQSSRPLQLPVAQITEASVLHDGKAYHLFYQSFGGGIYLSSSPDAERWSAPKQMSPVGESPSISLAPNGEYTLLYEGPDEQGWNIYQLRSSNLVDWSTPRPLTQLKRARWGRMLSLPKTQLFVFSGQDNQGNWTLYQRKSLANGQWSSNQPLVENQMRNTNAQLVALGEQEALLSWEVSSLTQQHRPQIALKRFRF